MEIIDDEEQRRRQAEIDDDAEPPGPTLDELCADKDIRQAFADDETNAIFKEIDDDPTTIPNHKDKPKVKHVLQLIFNKLEPYIPEPKQPPPQQGQMNSMAGLMQRLQMQSQGGGSANPMDFLNQMQSGGGGAGDMQAFLQQLNSMGGRPNRRNKGFLSQ